jgi:hypothetical protein
MYNLSLVMSDTTAPKVKGVSPIKSETRGPRNTQRTATLSEKTEHAHHLQRQACRHGNRTEGVPASPSYDSLCMMVTIDPHPSD